MSFKFWWEQRYEHLSINNNKLYFESHLIEKIVKSYNTPLYLYSKKRIKKKYFDLYNCLNYYFKNNFKVHYAMKSNSNDDILKLLLTLGSGVDCTSPGEVQKALDIGFNKEDIVFTGTSLSNKDLLFIKKNKILFNADSFSSIKRFTPVKGTPIVIRVNPGFGDGRNHKLITAGNKLDSRPIKFGIHENNIIEAFKYSIENGFKPIGIHFHIGSDWLEIDNFIASLEKVVVYVKKINEAFNINLKILDIGGGIGTPHSENEHDFPLKSYTEKISRILSNNNLMFEKIIIEPGQFLTSDAGVLITEVNTVEKKGDYILAGVNTGFNVFNSPAFYNYYHEIINCSNVKDIVQTYTIAGNLCENIDLFAVNRNISQVREGDFLAILHAGAYGSSMSSNYNLRPKAKEICY